MFSNNLANNIKQGEWKKKRISNGKVRKKNKNHLQIETKDTGPDKSRYTG